MKKRILLFILGLFAFFFNPVISYAKDNYYDFPITPPITCAKPEKGEDVTKSCPGQLVDTYIALGEPCAVSYEDFLTDPVHKHYWVEDQDITAQGKADDRARQFLYWVLNTTAIDEAPVLRTVWNVSSLIALFGVVLVAAIFGIGYIVSQRTNYNFNIRIWPTVIKIGVMLLYIAFSAALVFVLIQLSEVIMKFFYENLGGRDLFNIYFDSSAGNTLIGQTEQNYKGFVGCRDLNIRVKEGIDAEIFLLKMTNVTYYVMGIMLLLRKILLWFLLFVSPFLALLMPFILIRNTGWIWIGVFFQWLFYGPLLTLFLGGMAKIWQEGIPWTFDFSRVSKPGAFDIAGYVYPTGINIVYGGPAQRLSFNRPIDAANNGNYIDTFAEYIITLIMLWAVTFFPWWLLRIFRDYCCEGIYAMKNILMAMYDQMRGGSAPTGPSPTPPPKLPGLKLDLPTQTKTDIRVNIANLQNISNTTSRDIAKTLNLTATHITDVARVETNKQASTTMNQNLTYLSNPIKAKTPVERQQFMKLRAELFNRAIKSDSVANTMLASTSTSQVERTRVYKEILKTMPVTVKVSVEQVTSQVTKQPQERVKGITNTYTKTLTTNNSVVNNISQSTSTSNETVKKILNSYSQHTTEPITTVVQTIARETSAPEKTVRAILNQSGAIGIKARILEQTSQVQKLTKEQTTRILESIRTTVNKTTNFMNSIMTTTGLPPEPIQQYISNVYNSATTNESMIQQISNGSGTPPEQVKTIINSYTAKIITSNKSPQTIINETAKELNTNANTIQNVMNATNQTLQTSNIVKDEAQKQNITLPQAQTIMATVATPPVVQSPATTTNTLTQELMQKQDVSSVNETTVQDIVESFASNETLVQQVAQETNINESNVKNILYSYAQNLSSPSQNITQSISQQTGVENTQVQNVIQNVTSNINKNAEIIKNVAENIKVDEPTVQKVVNAIPQTITIQQVVPNIDTITYQTSLSKEVVTNVVKSFSTSQELIQQVAQNTNQSESNVTSVLQAYSTNIETSESSLINTISAQTGIQQTDVQSIITNTATTLATNPGIQNTIAQKNSVETPVVKVIANTVGNDSPVIQNIMSQTSSVTEESLQNLFSNISTNESLIQQVSESTHIEAPVIKKLIQSFETNLHQVSSNIAQDLSKVTNLSNEQIQQVLTTISNQVNSSSEIKQSLSQSTNMSEKTIENITQSLPQIIQTQTVSSENTPVVKLISANSNTSETVSQSTVKNIMNSIVENNTIMETLESQTGLKQQQITNVINTYTQNMNQTPEKIIEKISQTSGVEKDHVRETLNTISNTILSSDTVMQEVAKTENMKQDDVANVIQNQMQVAVAPEQHIEKTISIPQSVSLEDYEEVKKMWTKHYEEGEVPVTDTIQDRETWVDQEIVFITNTLNKLLSPDEKLRQEGLDELGYLLPIFLINNLKGEELIVYLKAKLEAAKSTQKLLEHEAKVREKVKAEQDQDEEQFVDVKTKKEEDKHMQMDDEDEEEKAPQSIEDRVKAVQQKLSNIESEPQESTIDDIKQKLQEEAEKNSSN